MTTGSVSTKRVRTFDYAAVGAPPAPTWSVTQYRRGELDAAKQAQAILTRPAADTYVRVGPFATREETERLRHVLAGNDACIVEASGSREAPAYGVRLGPYDDVEAAAAMARIAAAGFNPEAGPQAAAAAGGLGR